VIKVRPLGMAENTENRGDARKKERNLAEGRTKSQNDHEGRKE